MGPNKYNIGDTVNVTSKFKIVGITAANNNDIYYELVSCEENEGRLAYNFGYRSADIARVKEENLKAIASKYLWGKEE